MTFEKILSDLAHDLMTAQKAKDEICSKDKLKRINYFTHIQNITKEPLKDGELTELNAIVGILQILYNSSIDSPITDSSYDTMQEMLVDMGIPRLTGSVEINSASKLQHKFTNLRGTLSKVYYLTSSEKRTNKSRKYLDEWVKRMEGKYKGETGEEINLNDVRVLLQPKFDGASCVLETGTKPVWITRGDTGKNLASDVSHIMNIFNDVYAGEDNIGVKFEVMITEDNKDKINELYRHKQYKNSRQIVTSIFNSNEADFKADYLYPVPLRIMHSGDKFETIHPTLMEKFPTKICQLSDREAIREFGNENRWVLLNGMRFRTDGVVITIMDPKIQEVLGRDDDINNFEVAYKFTEESAYTKVKAIEFYVSEFGYVTPVLIVHNVILKGNTISRISLSNKERFDELGLSYGDGVKVLYDIIPYAIVDEKCQRVKNGRTINFVERCPRCNCKLDLDVVQVQCMNMDCPSRVIGRVLNYCTSLRIQNIGASTLESLSLAGLLDKGIRSLYKLKKKIYEMNEIEGFGKLKSRKIVAEIESKRVLKDYEFFGALSIEGLSTKTFQSIFAKIPYYQFMDMIKLKNFELMMARLLEVDGIAEKKAEGLVSYLKDTALRVDLQKLIEMVSILETYGDKTQQFKGKIVFSGCRPSNELTKELAKMQWEASDVFTKGAKCVVIPEVSYESSKVTKAREMKIPIVVLDASDPMSSLKRGIPGM